RTDLSPVFLLNPCMNRMPTPDPHNAVAAMSARHTQARYIGLMMLLALLAASSNPVFAQVRSGDMPENASASLYGNGWMRVKKGTGQVKRT
ncbi:MAG TPA: hypothetical protein VLA11_09130, partial [Woeseiaceae bacterium]|nr:hypothetical protein [Woeseiaceae bacterium]